MVSWKTDKAVILKMHMLIWNLLIFIMEINKGRKCEAKWFKSGFQKILSDWK